MVFPLTSSGSEETSNVEQRASEKGNVRNVRNVRFLRSNDGRQRLGRSRLGGSLVPRCLGARVDAQGMSLEPVQRGDERQSLDFW